MILAYGGLGASAPRRDGVGGSTGMGGQEVPARLGLGGLAAVWDWAVWAVWAVWEVWAA